MDKDGKVSAGNRAVVAEPDASDVGQMVRREVLRPVRAALSRRGRQGAELLLLRRTGLRRQRPALVGAVRRRVQEAQRLRHHAGTAGAVQGHRPAHAEDPARLQRRDGGAERGGLLQAGLRLAPAARHDHGLRPRRPRPATSSSSATTSAPNAGTRAPAPTSPAWARTSSRPRSPPPSRISTSGRASGSKASTAAAGARPRPASWTRRSPIS